MSGALQRGMNQEDVHAILIARVAMLGFPEKATDHSHLLGVAEAWLAAACREVPGFADWLDERGVSSISKDFAPYDPDG